MIMTARLAMEGSEKQQQQQQQQQSVLYSDCDICGKLDRTTTELGRMKNYLNSVVGREVDNLITASIKWPGT